MPTRHYSSLDLRQETLKRQTVGRGEVEGTNEGECVSVEVVGTVSVEVIATYGGETSAA